MRSRETLYTNTLEIYLLHAADHLEDMVMIYCAYEMVRLALQLWSDPQSRLYVSEEGSDHNGAFHC